MNSKAKILTAINHHKPAFAALPAIPTFNIEITPLLLFQEMIQTGGGTAILNTDNELLTSLIQTLFPHATAVASEVKEIPGNIDLATIRDPQDLESVEVAILRSELAVAENGAIWVTGLDAVHRVLPFITQHLVIVINADFIVQNMHNAYQNIDMVQNGFGVFIAGPSKTADIEQSLVIGAQGARSLTVIIEVVQK